MKAILSRKPYIFIILIFNAPILLDATPSLIINIKSAIQDTIPVKRKIDFDTVTTFNPRTYEERITILPKEKAKIRRERIARHRRITSVKRNHKYELLDKELYYYQEDDGLYVEVVKRFYRDKDLLETIRTFDPGAHQERAWFRYKDPTGRPAERVRIDEVTTYDPKTYKPRKQKIVTPVLSEKESRIKENQIENYNRVTVVKGSKEGGATYYFQEKDGSHVKVYANLKPDLTILKTINAFDPIAKKGAVFYQYKNANGQPVEKFHIDIVTTFDPETYKEQRTFVIRPAPEDDSKSRKQ